MDKMRFRHAAVKPNVDTASPRKMFRAAIIRVFMIAVVFILLLFVPHAAQAQGAEEPTQISIGAPTQANVGDLLTVQAVLIDSRGHPISKATIYFTTQADFLNNRGDVVLAKAVTNKDGQAVAHFKNDFSGTITLLAEFRGDDHYAASDAATEMAVLNDKQAYVEHVGVDLPGLNVPPRLAPMASLQSPSQIERFIQNLWPAMNGWPVAAALFIVWLLYLVAVRFIFRIAVPKSEEVESTSFTDQRRSS